MNVLIDNITKFVSLMLDLYSPLPFDLFADLHTLNAYLRSYSPNEQQLMESYLIKLEEKLDKQMKGRSKGNQYMKGKGNEEMKDKGNEEMKGKGKVVGYDGHSMTQQNYRAIDDKENRRENENKIELAVSSRGGRNQKEAEGSIKSEIFKFEHKHSGAAREAMQHPNFVFKIQRNRQKVKEGKEEGQRLQNVKEQSSLKSIKSEAEFHPQTVLPARKKSTDMSQQRRAEYSKGRTLNQRTNQPKRNTSSSSLRIKLKPRATYDIWRMREGVSELDKMMRNNEEELVKLMRELQEEGVEEM